MATWPPGCRGERGQGEPEGVGGQYGGGKKKKKKRAQGKVGRG